MKPSEIVNEIYLHDSSIEKLEFNEEKKELFIHIELCNWMQKWYEEEEPEVVFRILHLTGIENLSFDSYLQTEIDNPIISIEIQKTEVIYISEKQPDTLVFHVGAQSLLPNHPRFERYTSIPYIIEIQCQEIYLLPTQS